MRTLRYNIVHNVILYVIHNRLQGCHGTGKMGNFCGQGNTQGICQKILKICSYTGNLPWQSFKKLGILGDIHKICISGKIFAFHRQHNIFGDLKSYLSSLHSHSYAYMCEPILADFFGRF